MKTGARPVHRTARRAAPPDTAPAQACSGRDYRQRLRSRTPALTGCLHCPRPARGASVHCSSGPSRCSEFPRAPGRIWRALSCSRETTAPANEKARPQMDGAGPRPAPPLGSPILGGARRVGRRDRGKIACRLAARVAGRLGSLRAEIGKEMSGRPRPVPRVPGQVPDCLAVGWAPGATQSRDRDGTCRVQAAGGIRDRVPSQASARPILAAPKALSGAHQSSQQVGASREEAWKGGVLTGETIVQGRG